MARHHTRGIKTQRALFQAHLPCQPQLHLVLRHRAVVAGDIAVSQRIPGDVALDEVSEEAGGIVAMNAALGTAMDEPGLVADEVMTVVTGRAAPMRYIGWPENPAHGKGPLRLQDHGDNSRVSYRNIWVRPLDKKLGPDAEAATP